MIDDLSCLFQPNCVGRYYTGKYNNRGFNEEFRRRKRRSVEGEDSEDSAKNPAKFTKSKSAKFTEYVIAVFTVTSLASSSSPETTLKSGGILGLSSSIQPRLLKF